MPTCGCLEAIKDLNLDTPWVRCMIRRLMGFREIEWKGLCQQLESCMGMVLWNETLASIEGTRGGFPKGVIFKDQRPNTPLPDNWDILVMLN